MFVHFPHFLCTFLVVLIELFFLLWRQQVVHFVLSAGTVKHVLGLRLSDRVHLGFHWGAVRARAAVFHDLFHLSFLLLSQVQISERIHTMRAFMLHHFALGRCGRCVGCRRSLSSESERSRAKSQS